MASGSVSPSICASPPRGPGLPSSHPSMPVASDSDENIPGSSSSSDSEDYQDPRGPGLPSSHPSIPVASDSDEYIPGSSSSSESEDYQDHLSNKKRNKKRKKNVPADCSVLHKKACMSSSRPASLASTLVSATMDCATPACDPGSDNTSEDSGCEGPDETEIMRFIDSPGLFIRKISHSKTTKTGKKKKNLRVHNTYQYCNFCKLKVSNYSQHVRRRHKSVPQVKAIVELTDKKEQVRQLQLIRLEHNHHFNLQSLKKSRGEIFLDRRPTVKLRISDLGPCPACKAWVEKKQLWRHQQTCKAQPQKQTQAALVTQSDTLSLRISQVASQKLKDEVFSRMNLDAVGLLARSDPLIIGLGNIWIEKNISNPLKRGKYTAQVMRLNATLLRSLRKIKPLDVEMSMWNYLCKENFDAVVEGTFVTAAASAEDKDDLMSPSNAIKLGFDVKRMLNIKKAFAIMADDEKSRKDVDSFKVVMETFWATRVTKLARTLLLDRQFNKEVEMPTPDDLRRMNLFLGSAIKKLDLTAYTMSNFKVISETLATKLTLYNRRRPGEMENLRWIDVQLFNWYSVLILVFDRLMTLRYRLVSLFLSNQHCVSHVTSLLMT